MTATTAKTAAVYAIYPQSIALNEVLQTLAQGGFDKESICMMIAPTHPVAEMVREANTASFERDTQAAKAGLIGWLSEFGAVLIPTFGFFIRSREFFHALVVEQDSIAYCGRHGTLVALGFSEKDARRCEHGLRESGVLVYVSCANSAQTQWALELMRTWGTDEIGLLPAKSKTAVTAPMATRPVQTEPVHGGAVHSFAD
ncbi:MAG: hypothetical protein WAN03_10255 [Candidatus Sulfotelmatobacter sp.]